MNVLLPTLARPARSSAAAAAATWGRVSGNPPPVQQFSVQCPELGHLAAGTFTGPAASHVGLCYSLHEGYMRFGAFGIKQNLLDGFGVHAGSENYQHHGSHMAFGCQGRLWRMSMNAPASD